MQKRCMSNQSKKTPHERRKQATMKTIRETTTKENESINNINVNKRKIDNTSRTIEHNK